MPKLFIFALLLLLGMTGCGREAYELPEAQELPAPMIEEVSYQRDIRPILDNKCLACHACFDAPCQLKLENAAGLMRGAHPQEIYDGKRTQAATPTRLLMDAESEESWRELGFFSLFDNTDQPVSLLENMLALAKKYPLPANSKIPEGVVLGIKRDNYCATPDNFEDYATKHPLEGMPFAVAGLSDIEYATITGWLQQGAEIDEVAIELTQAETRLIEQWESFLNQSDKEQRLLSRWLYEHLFLAHLYFDEDASEPRFFELVRSYTPPGEAIEIVNTRLPNTDPEQAFYYRLRPVIGTIVHKRHITLPFDAAMLQRIQSLFYAEPWSVAALPGYEYADRANPFITFNDIPVKARYQFMLEHAEYFTRTFIRGPVCRGQIATDVIRDHFWLFYQDPDYDLFVTDKAYREAVMPLLGLPGQNDSLLEVGRNWDKYRTKRNEYHTKKMAAYSEQPQWASLDAIWDGDGENQNALLTIFRNFDSASVKKGLIGRIPETIWWKDYPLFERSYYELVVNFDVFGNLAHQLQTRLYFDLIRNGAEHNYLRLIPASERRALLDRWYDGSGKLKTHITYADLDEQTPAAETYESESPHTELAEKILQRFAKVNRAADDPLNRCEENACYRPEQAEWIQHSDQILSRLAATTAKRLPGVRNLPEMTFVRVRQSETARTVYSITRDRAHSNVAFMFGESLRHQPKKDYLTVYPGIAGSYPNFIFDVPLDELESFVTQLAEADDQKAFESIVVRWGVRRTHPEFWEILHDFTAWHTEQTPLEAGIFDINRYENL